jgi:hypothetical protein
MDAGNGSRWRWDPLERGARSRTAVIVFAACRRVWQSVATDAIARTRQVADQSRQKSLNRAGLS